MKRIAILAVVMSALLVAGCDQWAARSGFGKMTTQVPCGNKLEMVTWKGNNAELWTAYRPFRSGEVPETHTFKATTLFGVFQGEVILVESLCK